MNTRNSSPPEPVMSAAPEVIGKAAQWMAEIILEENLLNEA